MKAGASQQATLTDRWQSSKDEQRMSGEDDAITRSVREVLLPKNGQVLLRSVAPNSKPGSVRSDAARAEDTRPMRETAVLPDTLPKSPSPEIPVRFVPLQKWEGTVTAMTEIEFTAVLREPGEHDEEATFDIEEIPPGDRHLVCPGAVFYWSVGYRDRSQRVRESLIRFRRLPVWTKKELARAEREADEIISALQWGKSQSPR